MAFFLCACARLGMSMLSCQTAVAAQLFGPSLLAAAALPCHAELLLHVQPDRLREMQQVLHGLDGVMQQYAQVSSCG